MIRISKNQIIFGGNYFAATLGNSSCWIVWDKDNGESFFADCELAWTSFTTAVRKFKFKWNGMLQEDMKNKEFRYHPTQKPVELMKWCLEKYSKETDSIIDPFLGSGSTLLAAKQLKRNAVENMVNFVQKNVLGSIGMILTDSRRKILFGERNSLSLQNLEVNVLNVVLMIFVS